MTVLSQKKLSRYVQQTISSDRADNNSITSMTLGTVVDNSDPMQNGRLKVMCPAIDDASAKPDELPWCNYVSPFGGVTANMTVGPEGTNRPGNQAYGFWAIPKMNANVIVFFLNGDPSQLYWLGCVFRPNENVSLPAGINSNGKIVSNDGKPSTRNANLSLSGLNDSTKSKIRGWYERQVASKGGSGSEGYAKTQGKGAGKDSQIFCFVTPGGHYLTMSDTKEYCRTRLRTTSGHQILMDDTNGMIYVGTDKGNTWMELNSNGNLYVYGSQNISIAAGQNINMNAGQAVYITAGTDVHIKAGSNIKASSGALIDLNAGSSCRLTAGGSIDIKGSGIKQTAGAIHLNGPAAASAGTATAAPVVPGHEPWDRT